MDGGAGVLTPAAARAMAAALVALADLAEAEPDPEEVDELAAAIVKAFRDPTEWQRRSDAARGVAIDQAPERVGAALRAVYEGVLAGAAN
jgi:hypothetical protein